MFDDFLTRSWGVFRNMFLSLYRAVESLGFLILLLGLLLIALPVILFDYLFGD